MEMPSDADDSETESEHYSDYEEQPVRVDVVEVEADAAAWKVAGKHEIKSETSSFSPPLAWILDEDDSIVKTEEGDAGAMATVDIDGSAAFASPFASITTQLERVDVKTEPRSPISDGQVQSLNPSSAPASTAGNCAQCGAPKPTLPPDTKARVVGFCTCCKRPIPTPVSCRFDVRTTICEACASAKGVKIGQHARSQELMPEIKRFALAVRDAHRAVDDASDQYDSIVQLETRRYRSYPRLNISRLEELSRRENELRRERRLIQDECLEWAKKEESPVESDEAATKLYERWINVEAARTRGTLERMRILFDYVVTRGMPLLAGTKQLLVAAGEDPETVKKYEEEPSTSQCEKCDATLIPERSALVEDPIGLCDCCCRVVPEASIIESQRKMSFSLCTSCASSSSRAHKTFDDHPVRADPAWTEELGSASFDLQRLLYSHDSQTPGLQELRDTSDEWAYHLHVLKKYSAYELRRRPLPSIAHCKRLYTKFVECDQILMNSLVRLVRARFEAIVELQDNLTRPLKEAAKKLYAGESMPSKLQEIVDKEIDVPPPEPRARKGKSKQKSASAATETSSSTSGPTARLDEEATVATKPNAVTRQEASPLGQPSTDTKLDGCLEGKRQTTQYLYNLMNILQSAPGASAKLNENAELVKLKQDLKEQLSTTKALYRKLKKQPSASKNYIHALDRQIELIYELIEAKQAILQEHNIKLSKKAQKKLEQARATRKRPVSAEDEQPLKKARLDGELEPGEIRE